MYIWASQDTQDDHKDEDQDKEGCGDVRMWGCGADVCAEMDMNQKDEEDKEGNRQKVLSRRE